MFARSDERYTKYDKIFEKKEEGLENQQQELKQLRENNIENGE